MSDIEEEISVHTATQSVDRDMDTVSSTLTPPPATYDCKDILQSTDTIQEERPSSPPSPSTSSNDEDEEHVSGIDDALPPNRSSRLSLPQHNQEQAVLSSNNRDKQNVNNVTAVPPPKPAAQQKEPTIAALPPPQQQSASTNNNTVVRQGKSALVLFYLMNTCVPCEKISTFGLYVSYFDCLQATCTNLMLLLYLFIFHKPLNMHLQGDSAIMRAALGERPSTTPGAHHINGVGRGNNNINSTSDRSLTAVVTQDIEMNSNLAVAEPVPDDEEVAYGVRVPDNAGTPARRSSFSAVVLDSVPVLEVSNPTIVPSQEELNEISRDLKKYYWQRLAFRVCVVCGLLAIGLGLGLGLGLNNGGDGSEGQNQVKEAKEMPDNFVISLQGEYEGQSMGSSVAMTKGAGTILVGSPEFRGTDRTGGLTQLFFLNRTNHTETITDHDHTDDGSIDVQTSKVTSGVLFSSSANEETDHSGVSVSITAFGEAMAIGYSSSLHFPGKSYVKAFLRNKDKSHVQVGQTLYGDYAKDGFGSSVSITQIFNPQPAAINGLLLLIGSLNGGYAQLWAAPDLGEGKYGMWSRLDKGDIFNHKIEGVSSEIVVSMAGASGRRIFLGSPNENNHTGVVRTYALSKPVRSASNSSILTAEIVEEEVEDPNMFMGDNPGELFGSSISTDKQGHFVIMAARRGGYARTFHLPKDSWQVLSTISTSQVLTSVDTGKISVGNSCRICANDINSTRVVVASNSEAFIYQYNIDKDKWIQLGDSIAASEDNDCQPNEVDQAYPNYEYKVPHPAWQNDVAVAMSPDSAEIAVTCPESNNQRGKVSVWKIPDI